MKITIKSIPLFFSLLVLAMSSLAQPLDVMPSPPNNNFQNISRIQPEPCIDISTAYYKNNAFIGSNGVGLHRDCLVDYLFHFELEADFSCFERLGCTDKNKTIAVEIAGELIYSKNLTEFERFDAKLNLTPWIENLSVGVHEIRLKYCAECPVGPLASRCHTVTSTFRVTDDTNDIYYTQHIDYSTAPKVLWRQCVDDEAICCMLGNEKRFEYSWNTSYSHISDSSIFTAYEIQLGADFYLDTGIVTALPSSPTFHWNQFNQNKINTSYILTSAQDACVAPEIVAYGRPMFVQTWRSVCGGPDELISERSNDVLTDFTIGSCSPDPRTDCPPIDPPAFNHAFEDALTCSGLISSPYTEDLDIVWTGPNGFRSNQWRLCDLSLGTYHYIITNQCCASISGTITLCQDDLNYGAFELNPNTGQYCREVRCGERPTVPGQDTVCSYTQCADREVSFENNTCVTRYFVNGELIEEMQNNPRIEVEYNPVTESCTRKVYCDNNQVSENVQQATFGAKSFNYGTLMCEQEVFCFGSSTNEIKTTAAEISEAYDNTTKLCNKTAFCDQIPYPLPPAPPIANWPWSYDELNGCQKRVQCSPQTPLEIIEGTANFSLWSWNDFSDQCEATLVSCDNEVVGGARHLENPRTSSFWTWIRANPLQRQCQRIHYCGDISSPVYEYTSPTFISTGVECSPGVFQNRVYCDGQNTGFTTCLNAEGDIIQDRSGQEDEINTGIQVYPNPFTNELLLSGIDDVKFSKIALYNTIGQLVFHTKIVENGRLNISHLPSGFYLLKIYNSKEVIKTEKLIKK